MRSVFHLSYSLVVPSVVSSVAHRGHFKELCESDPRIYLTILSDYFRFLENKIFLQAFDNLGIFVTEFYRVSIVFFPCIPKLPTAYPGYSDRVAWSQSQAASDTRRGVHPGWG